jgi:hypothetical protein
MVTVVTTVVLVAYNITHDHGSGLSPIPTHIQTYITTMLNILIPIYITRNMHGHRLGGLSQRFTLPPEVTGSTPAECKGFNQQASDTWRPLIGPRVTFPFAANKTCHMPTVCHISIWSATSSIRSATSSSVRTVRTAQSTSIFLPVCHFEQNAISLIPDVCLNPNELRWVHNNEAYALVRFEAIPSTLNF